MVRTNKHPLPAWDALWWSFRLPLRVLSSQAPVMADSTPAITLVTSGPVPAVSAPTLPASSVPKDSALALDDLPPPPPPAEPYEVFMARVQRDLSSLPVRSTQPGAAVPPRAAVATPTTGSRLPTPFPRFEDSSWAWALQPQAPNTRIRMPLPASCYVTPPSPWVWPGRGSSVATTMVRGPLPATWPAGPPGPCGPSGLLAGPSAVGPSPVPPPTTPAADLKKTSPTPPALSRIRGNALLCFFLPGRQSMGGRRPVPIMVRLGTSLCISSGSHCSQDSPENPKIPGHHGHHDRITTSIPTVASTSSPVEHTSSDLSPRRPTVPVCAQPPAPSIPPRSQTIGSSRLELIRDVLKCHHFPDTVVDMAADPLRDSSSNVYNSH